MNTLTMNPCCAAPRRRILPLIDAALDRIRHYRRIARDTRRLAGLSDYQLRDIGISRGDIPRAVRYGRERDTEVSRLL